MFNYKIIIIVVLLIILIYFAYTEYSYIHTSLNDIHLLLSKQNSDTCSHVEKCVNKIEQISKNHILELQNINKMNSQCINKMNKIELDVENDSEGLSPKVQPDTKEETNEKIAEKNEDNETQENVAIVNKEDPYLSNDDELKLPIYKPCENVSESEIDTVCDECDDEETPEIKNTTIPATDDINIIPEIQPACRETINGILNGLISMNDIITLNQSPPQTKSSVIIEQIDDKNDADDIKKNEDIISHLSEHVQELCQHTASPNTPEIPKQTLYEDNTSNHSSKSSKSSASKTSHKSSESSKSQKTPPKIDMTLQDIDKYKVVELKNIAKEHNIPTFVKSANNKYRQYNKKELYDVLKSYCK